jgi:hypothetical protein
MFADKFLVCPEIIFWYVPKIFFGDTPTILGRNINVQFASSGKIYCAPPNKIRPVCP